MFLSLYVQMNKKNLHLVLVSHKMKRDMKSVIFMIALMVPLCVTLRYEFSIKRNWIFF